MPSPASILRKSSGILLRAVSAIVFLFLDLLDSILCVLYCGLDWLLEGRVSSCYCTVREQCDDAAIGASAVVSETLHRRDNVFRQLGFARFSRKLGNIVGSWERRETGDGGGRKMVIRWSDCGCDSCASWMSSGGDKLHVAVKEPSIVNRDRAESITLTILHKLFLRTELESELELKT